MGQRANLVVVRGGTARIYYDHWCANVLDSELFWGPELATEFIEQRGLAAEDAEWLDEVWCEGAAIIDHDRKFLGWYGGEDLLYEIPTRRAFLALMRQVWAGWEIRWFCAGIVELGEYLGVPCDRFRSPQGSRRRRPFRVLTNYNETLLTVQASGGVSAAQVWGNIASLEVGAEQLPALLAIPRGPKIVWAGEMPRFGVHFDLDQRAVWYWSAPPQEFAEQRVASAWPGWQTHSLGDQFEEHLRMADLGIDLPIRNLVELQHDQLERLRRWHHHDARNPARESLNAVSEAMSAKETKLNPMSDVARGSVGTTTRKLEILDALARGIGPAAN